jgi:hypothetical protein
MSLPAIEWVRIGPGRVWRSVDGQYAIVAHTLPETPPRTVFQARRIDQAPARAYPDRGNLGILLTETSWCWNTENNLFSAEAECQRNAYHLARYRPVPRDYPAIALREVNNLNGGALVITRNEAGRLVAQAIGMGLPDRDIGYVPQVRQEIDLTTLGLVPREGVEPAVTTDHGPPPCVNCRVEAGQPHDEHCEDAICQVSGQQRLQCTYLGGSPVAGIEAVATNSQDEFETYFKTPTDHDCGHDIWAGKP